MGPNELFVTLTYAEFQSTHPVWDGTLSAYLSNKPQDISIHPSRVGWDGKFDTQLLKALSISIHPSRVGWDVALFDLSGRVGNISIHPSRVGWDAERVPKAGGCMTISIHPSRVGWDDAQSALILRALVFQSTHPVWDGTT